MQKMIYFAAIALLFIILIVRLWFFPVGRNLEADKNYLRQPPPIPGLK